MGCREDLYLSWDMKRKSIIKSLKILCQHIVQWYGKVYAGRPFPLYMRKSFFTPGQRWWGNDPQKKQYEIDVVSESY